MFRFAKWLPCVAALAGVVLLGTAGSARADTEVQLTISDGTAGGTVSATYDFSGSTPGFVGAPSIGGSSAGTFFVAGGPSGNQVLEFLGTVGAYNVNITTSTAQSNVPGNSDAFVSTQSGAITGTGTGLTITASSELFSSPSSPPAPALVLSASSSTTGSAGGSPNGTTMASYSGSVGSLAAGLGGSDYALVNGTYTIGAGGAGSGPAIFSSPFGASSYTLTSIVGINGGFANLSIQGRADVVAVPEPASMMAFLSAVPFLGVGAWLRRRKQVAIA